MHFTFMKFIGLFINKLERKKEDQESNTEIIYEMEDFLCARILNGTIFFIFYIIQKGIATNFIW